MSKEELAREAAAFHCPRYNELPAVGLYLEQVLETVNGSLAYLQHDPLTKPMISNYIKNGCMSSPEKKRYSREHLCYMMVIEILKPVFTLQQIARILEIQRETYPIDVAYNFFATEFENALVEAFHFTGEPLPCIETERTDQTILIRSMVLAAANRIFVEKSFLA